MQKNFILTWSANCVIAYCTASNQATTFVITDTKLLVPLESLSTNDNAKLLQQLKQNSNVQLTGINIIQKQQYSHKTNI